jgi:NitT/TauT family transport system permease protein
VTVRGTLSRSFALLIAVGTWWWATTTVWAGNPVLARMSPPDVVPTLWDHLAGGGGVEDVRTSLVRLVTGILVAACIGIPLGLALGASSALEHATLPLVNFLRMISPLAWAPIVIVALGVGGGPVIFLVAVTAVWPLALGTAAGVRAVSPAWHDVARSLGASRRERVRLVTVPAIRANVLTSLRLALGVGWIVLVPAEMLGVDSGLGYSLLNARDQLDYSLLAANVLLIGITGFLLDALFRRILSADR